jgi:oligopeptide/dipeptide ABC transporter ATP-binding protein
LQVKDLSTYFFTYFGTVEAVDRVNFSVEKREAFGLIGETGCGKSVTAMSILRLVPPPGKIIGGSILFKGKDLLRVTEQEMRSIRGKDIAVIFQEPLTSLNPLISVGDHVADIIRLHQGLERKEAWVHAIDLFSEVKIADPERVAKQYPYELSGGMRQRVMIAMALSCRPSLLIADEPTTAVDVTIQAQILHLLNELKAKYDTSFIIITHNMGVVAETCERVAVMYAGTVVENAKTSEIFDRPLHPYTIGLMETILTMDEEANVLKSIPGDVPSLVNPPSGCRFHTRCPSAAEICRKEKPAMYEITPGHFITCHRGT